MKNYIIRSVKYKYDKLYNIISIKL